MPTDIVMPSLSDTMEEGKILRWLKHQGDPVKKGDSLAEVETDKANMEIEAFEEGTLSEIIASEGESVPVGHPIARIAKPGEKAEQPKKEALFKEQKETMAPLHEQKLSKEEKEAESGEEGPVRVETQPKREIPTEAPPALERQRKPKESERIKASPLAQKLAEAYEIDLSTIQGSGPEGRIVEKDLDQAIREQKRRIPSEAVSQQIEQPSTLRQTIARQMVESKQQIPHFYVTMAVQGDRLVDFKTQLDAYQSDLQFTYNHILLKACSKALEQHPRLNASYHDDKLILHSAINIAIAVTYQDSLIAPVLHQVNKLSLRDIAEQSNALIQRVKENRLLQNDLTGGTFSLSNMGMYGVEEFTAIITPPQAAVLAVGSLQEIPIVQNGQIVSGYQLKLTLSADHRVVDGAEAAEFLQTLRDLLENPLFILI